MFNKNNCYFIISILITVLFVILFIIFMQSSNHSNSKYESFNHDSYSLNPNYNTCRTNNATINLSPDGMVNNEPNSKYELENNTLWTRRHYIIQDPKYNNVLPPASKTSERDRELLSHNNTDRIREDILSSKYFDINTQKDFQTLNDVGGSRTI